MWHKWHSMGLLVYKSNIPITRYSFIGSKIVGFGSDYKLMRTILPVSQGFPTLLLLSTSTPPKIKHFHYLTIKTPKINVAHDYLAQTGWLYWRLFRMLKNVRIIIFSLEVTNGWIRILMETWNLIFEMALERFTQTVIS